MDTLDRRGLAEGERIWQPNFFVTLSRRKKIFWPLVAGMVFCIFFGLLWISNRNKCEYCQDTQKYLVATQTIAPGQKIAGSIVLEERPRAFQTEASISDLSPNDLEGAIAKVTIYKGEVLVRDRYIDVQLTNINVVAIPVDEDERPPLKAGDRVDLFATDEDGNSESISADSFVYAVEDRVVSLILEEHEIGRVITALKTSLITVILVA